MKSIGDRAFCLCTGLTSITLPESIDSLANGVFLACSGIKTVSLPAGLKTLSDNVFNGCTSLTSINAKMATPVTVSENTFKDVPYDKCSLFVPEGSVNAYKTAEGWKNFNHIVEDFAGGIVVVVNEPGTLNTKISSEDKNKITKLKVVGSLNIDDIQFLREMAGCWLKENEKKTDGTLQYLNLKDALLVGSDKSINVYKEGGWHDKTNRLEATAKIEADGKNFSNLFRQLTKLNTVIMPEYLTTTVHGTFANSPLSSVALSSNITTISDSTFYGCNYLKAIELPTHVTSIGTRAFGGCELLSTITLPSGLTSIGTGAFSGCGFTEFVIPDGITTISNSLFSGCSKLTSITLPKGLTAIGASAFASCGFTEFVIPDGITTISDGLFSGCSKLTSITLPKGLTAIGASAFASCGFTEFVIPDGITTISDYLFSGCSNLESVTSPKTVRHIGKGIFHNCGFRTFTLPKEINVITDEMFSNCHNLQEIYLHDGVTSIGNSAFSDCDNMTWIKIPASVTSIGTEAFKCSALKEVSLPDGITEIPDGAFLFCENLRSIHLPAELTRIGVCAFEGCYNLGSSYDGLVIPSKVTEVGKLAFYKSCINGTDLVLPASLKTIGENVFFEMPFKTIHAFMVEPPVLSGNEFAPYDQPNMKLYVPKGSAQKYRIANVWKDFNIEEFDAAGITGMTNSATVKEVARYDDNGHLLTAPTKGLNIVRYSDGTKKKVMVK